ncbi:molybdopterin-binding protein, partial [Saccharothrix longispora]|nr:molybdopterin-binding protein [Saccharothrix longispora]
MKRWTAALVGLLGVAAALAAGHLVAALVGPPASPFLAVGNTAIDFTPSPVKDFAVRTFGTHDKLVLLLGMAVVLVVAALVAGLLSRRSPLPGTVLAVVLGLLGVAAVVYRPDLGQLGVLAPIASLVVGVAVFRALHARALRASAVPGPGATGSAGSGVDARRAGVDSEGRRRFLIASGATAVGAAVAGAGGQLLATRVDVEASRRAVGDLTPARPAPP